MEGGSLMSKLRKISLEETAQSLGFKPKYSLTPEQYRLLARKYLEQFNLTEVPLDPAYINNDGSINLTAYKETEVNNLLENINNEK